MTLAEVERVIVESGHSRLPVAASGSDDLLGVLLAKDLLRLPVAAQGEPVPLEVIRQMLVVPPTLLLEDVLLRMKDERNHLAVVRDDADHTLGVLTMEDVLEELVGEIIDETDTLRACLRAQCGRGALQFRKDRGILSPCPGSSPPL